MARRCLVNFQYQGVLLICIIVGQGPFALVVGADGDCFDIFLSSCFYPLAQQSCGGDIGSVPYVCM